MNKLQHFSQQLNKTRCQDRLWRGQDLARLAQGWDDSLDAYTNLEQIESWIPDITAKDESP